MIKLAVTGGTGFIGSWFIKEYFSRYDIIVIDPESFLNASTNKDPNVRYISTDYSIASICDIIKDVYGVVHLAAKRPISKSAKYSYSDFLVNIEISSNLFEACKIQNIKNIINISSTSVYGRENRIPYHEEDESLPDGFYGVSKKTIEILCEYYNRKYGMFIKTLRLAHVIGAGEREDFMLMVFITRARRKETLNIYGKGEGRREYIYVKDVTSAIAQAIKAEKLYGIFNIGTGYNTSHKELAEMINNVFENEDNLTFIPGKNEDKSIDLMDVTNAQKFLFWKAEWSLRDSLEDIRKYFKTYS